MKCICIRKHQRKDDTKVRPYWVTVGDTMEFDECPAHFKPVSEHQMDFAMASENELLSDAADLEAMKAFIKNTFDVSAGNRGKEKTVEMLLDLRYRQAQNLSDLT